MSLDTLRMVCQRVFEDPFFSQELRVAWHGGEPLAVRVGWYEEATALMASMCPPELHVQHCFQTNGLLLNKEWTRFFARIGARVGLSIDGPADIHDANRRTRRGQGTHQQVMRAVRLLHDENLRFHVITVLTERALDHPKRLFDFYVQNGIEEVGFNVEEIEGTHKHSSLEDGNVETRLRKFIKCFLELTWRSPGLLRVREFESAIGSFLSDGPMTDEQTVPFAIVTIGCDGTISTFSPELLGATHPRFEHFALGNVATHTFRAIEHAPLFRTMHREIQRGVSACARSCRYFRWCGGGAPANKLFETGSFAATETMHCRLSRQVWFDEVLAGVESHTVDSTTP